MDLELKKIFNIFNWLTILFLIICPNLYSAEDETSTTYPEQKFYQVESVHKLEQEYYKSKKTYRSKRSFGFPAISYLITQVSTETVQLVAIDKKYEIKKEVQNIVCGYTKLSPKGKLIPIAKQPNDKDIAMFKQANLKVFFTISCDNEQIIRDVLYTTTVSENLKNEIIKYLNTYHYDGCILDFICISDEEVMSKFFDWIKTNSEFFKHYHIFICIPELDPEDIWRRQFLLQNTFGIATVKGRHFVVP